MILIFGGTTEGRLAARVCDEAHKPYYYSTKGDSRQLDSMNAVRLTGTLDLSAMIDVCKGQDIRLIVDAAHPFAEKLHKTIAGTSEALQIPVIRYERSYPEHDDNLVWFDTYEQAIDYLENNNIDNLLALTGVNTISKMKRYWQSHKCRFRILDRDESRAIADKEGFPAEYIIYYNQEEDETALFSKLKPQAIITKESGDSGGFGRKVEAARKSGIPLLVVKRPTLSGKFISIYGEHGLRKAIEKLLPCFFELKTGYTTGTCAAAATKAALTALLTNEVVDKVSITLPDGEQVMIPIDKTGIDKEKATSSVIKDSGDDPDITNGKEICSTVRLNAEHKGVRFLQGEGVGVVTLPGLGLEIGGPAINATPRRMMKREIFKVLRHYQDKLPDTGLKTGVDITISVPDGKEIALKTFNPKLGIEGGISIIGTSGVIKPFSSEAFVNSIRRGMQVARALGCERVVINSGAKSEKYVKAIYPTLPPQAFIHYGNFIGETIKITSELGFKAVTLGIMIGKAVKLAEGSLDTHSRKAVMNKEFISELARKTGYPEVILSDIQNITMARQLWDIIPADNRKFFRLLLNKCYETCSPLFPDGELTILLIDEEGNIVS
ncbi:MAG: cobalt-precorrin-5B (C(1))-methyltransferase CbiD [Prevotella sp.]|jgi:cobalt-precorrin-5B (C1)-methyltransferase|nr:cobalt-precorrin-5B (C(1))-methyltransferase CbiD [Prevotella sp.]